MSAAKNGDTVKVNYTGRLDSGMVFDSTENRQPFEFVLGQNRLISGFEKAVLGMSPGESKTVKLPPEEAYGPRRDEMVATVDRNRFAPDVEPKRGQMLKLHQPDGSTLEAKVTDVTEANITLDANHPLAGHALNFDISLVEVG